LQDWITIVNTKSEEFAKFINPNLPVRILYIDGDHGYECVKNDILLYSNMVVSGGFIVFHDYHADLLDEGVYRASEELIRHSPDWEDFQVMPSMMLAYARRAYYDS
jgi:hypothetical protein